MSSGRAVAVFTVLYWPVALFAVGLSGMGDCFLDDAVCEAAFNRDRDIALGIATVAYLLSVFFVVRKRRDRGS